MLQKSNASRCIITVSYKMTIHIMTYNLHYYLISTYAAMP